MNFNELFINAAFRSFVMCDWLREYAPDKERLKNTLTYALYKWADDDNNPAPTIWDADHYSELGKEIAIEIPFLLAECVDWDYVAAEITKRYCKDEITRLAKGLTA